MGNLLIWYLDSHIVTYEKYISSYMCMIVPYGEDPHSWDTTDLQFKNSEHLPLIP